MSLPSRLAFLAKDTLFYGGITATVRFSALITTPIIARVLSPADYGAVDVATVFLTALMSLTLLGQDSAIARYYHDTDCEAERKTIISTGLWISVPTSFFIGALVYTFSDEICGAWGLDRDQSSLIFSLAAVALPFSVLSQHFMGLLKWTFRRLPYFILASALTLTLVGSVVLFLTFLGMGKAGVLRGQILAQCVGAGLGLWFCRDLIGLTFSFPQARRLLAFGWPYMIIWVGSTLQSTVDRFFVARHLSPESMGLFAAGAKAAALMSLVVGGFQIAWGPFAFSLFRRTDAPDIFSTVLLVYTGAALSLALGLSTFSAPIVSLLASARYLDGHVVVGFLALGIVINGLHWITSIGLVVSERPQLTALGYVIGVAGAFLLIFPLLVPRFGLLGAGLGTLGMQALITVLISSFAQRAHPYPYSFRTVVSLITLALACVGFQSLAGLPLNATDWLLRIALGLATITGTWIVVLRTLPDDLKAQGFAALRSRLVGEEESPP